jgi:hypothetical protein
MTQKKDRNQIGSSVRTLVRIHQRTRIANDRTVFITGTVVQLSAFRLGNAGMQLRGMFE